MKSRALAVVVAISALWSSGCGTVLNLVSRDPERYGGVAKDCQFALTSHVMNTPADFKGTIVVLALWLAEVCASGMADTLTLPLIPCPEPQIAQPEGGPEANIAPVKSDAQNYQAQFSVGAIAVSPSPEPAAVLGKPEPLDHVERP